jgi:thiol-disulfide isomerase/thioredoxin
MIRKKIVAFFFFLTTIAVGFSQSALQYSQFADLQSNILKDKEHIIVLNFWATWCKPCVAELPDFEKIQVELKANNVQVILANLDFHSKTEAVVPEFITRKNIQSNVVHITDQDPNDWVGKVDDTWSGSIPATVIYYKGEKKWFFEGQTDYETLKSIIYKYIQQ